MRVQTLLNKNSKLNPSGGTRPPIRFFFFFFFLFAPGNSTKISLVTAKHGKNNKSRVDLRFRDLTQKQESRWKRLSTRWQCCTGLFYSGTCWCFWKLFPTNQPLWFSVHRPAWRHFNLRKQLLTCSIKTPHRELFINCIRGLLAIFCSYWYICSPFHPLLSNTFPLFHHTFCIFHLFPSRHTKSFV